MPLSLQKLAQRRKACEFEYDGETVHLEYYPAALTPDAATIMNKFMADTNAASANDDEAGAEAALRDFGAWACTVLASWDVLGLDGETPEPITPENIAGYIIRFTDFMLAVFQTILDDRSAKNASGTPQPANSDATSSPTEKSDSNAAVASLSSSASSSSLGGSVAADPLSNG